MASRKPADETFSAEERAAMKEAAAERRAAKKRGNGDDEAGLLAKIAELPDPDRALAEQVHALVKAAAPQLTSRTWYGMPAWAKDGTVLCFLQPASRFKSRYATLGFNDAAALDDGPMWPASFALVDLTPGVADRISELVSRAVG